MTSLDGPWQFRRAGAAAWKTVSVPSPFEAHEGPGFDGAGEYAREVRLPRTPPGRRLLLQFDAAATETTVFWDGREAGRHLGGWTPFRIDLTALGAEAIAPGPHQLRVLVDEKVGHNTQGFLPVIAPHFGGLWQSVRLLSAPDPCLDDLKLLVWGDPETGIARIFAPLLGEGPVRAEAVKIQWRRLGETTWQAARAGVAIQGRVLRAWFRAPNAEPWFPEAPRLYEAEIRLSPKGDALRRRFAFRSVRVEGERLLLNGRPVQIRGLLNWGYAPPRNAPSLDPAFMRREIAFAKARGFNLMKFCLWIPPRAYLDLADETGMLAWMEYPTWHPRWDQAHRRELIREFNEFFESDRGHPSVVLRSLTCETGPGADLDITREIYQTAHRRIPFAVVEDDSSWIQWNRIADFYDDHPYGNCHDWAARIEGLKSYIRKRRIKPLLLGEAMAADTWPDLPALSRRFGAARPWQAPAAWDAQRRWLRRMAPLTGKRALARIPRDSLRYARLSRKYQIETYRRLAPQGGYVVSVIRDIPKASMGLIDYLSRPKRPAAEWSWQGDLMCLLDTGEARRSFCAGETPVLALWAGNFTPAPCRSGRLQARLLAPDGALLAKLDRQGLALALGETKQLARLRTRLPETSAPEPLRLEAEFLTENGAASNSWTLWLAPRPRPVVRAWADETVDAPLREALGRAAILAKTPDEAEARVCRRLTPASAAYLEEGGRLLLVPDGGKGSPPLADHWFLRGGPVIGPAAARCGAPPELLVDLQQFDLAGKIIPEPGYLEEVEPLLLLWDTHDLDRVKTHALAFFARAGRGRLAVSALRHEGAGNAAGRWLLERLLRRLVQGPPPKKALSERLWSRAKMRLTAEDIPLAEKTWQFRPDPQNAGVRAGWFRLKAPQPETWRPIRIGRAWESQGWPQLDGWAWYRLRIRIPARWKGRKVWLGFEGVDDMYELYVNGRLAGRRGDREREIDTFSERYSHDITRFVTPGQEAVLAVRVCDWRGAGGIFRPVTLSAAPLPEPGDLIR